MARKKLPYKEGDWFAVPLRNGGYALGLAARVTRGGGILGYFFGPRRETVPTKEDIQGLTPEDAVLIRHFGDLGLLRGEWPMVAETKEWRREEWPQPAFGRIDIVDPSKAVRVEYDDSDVHKVLRETPISLEEARHLPEDGLSGYGAVEIRLTRLLSG